MCLINILILSDRIDKKSVIVQFRDSSDENDEFDEDRIFDIGTTTMHE